jgi:ribosomal protein S8E
MDYTKPYSNNKRDKKGLNQEKSKKKKKFGLGREKEEKSKKALKSDAVCSTNRTHIQKCIWVQFLSRERDQSFIRISFDFAS